MSPSILGTRSRVCVRSLSRTRVHSRARADEFGIHPFLIPLSSVFSKVGQEKDKFHFLAADRSSFNISDGSFFRRNTEDTT